MKPLPEIIDDVIPPRKFARLEGASLDTLMRPASWYQFAFTGELAKAYDREIQDKFQLQFESVKSDCFKVLRESIRRAWIAVIEQIRMEKKLTQADMWRRSLHSASGASNWFSGTSLPGEATSLMVGASEELYRRVIDNRIVWLIGLREAIYWIEQCVLGQQDGRVRLNTSDVLVLVEEHNTRYRVLFDEGFDKCNPRLSDVYRILKDSGHAHDCLGNEAAFNRFHERWWCAFQVVSLLLSKHELRLG